MKPIKLHRLAAAILLLMLLFIIVSALSRCTSTKKINTSKQTFDSVSINILKDSLRVIKEDNYHLEQQLKQSEYSSVTFDNTKCPPCDTFPLITNESMIKKDTVNALIKTLNNIIKSKNKELSEKENIIRVYSDGTREYKGKFDVAIFKNEKQAKTILDIKKENDSLRNVLQQNNTTVAKVDEKKDVDKKTSILNWWHFLIIGFVAGGIVLVPLDRKTKIFKIFG